MVLHGFDGARFSSTAFRSEVIADVDDRLVTADQLQHGGCLRRATLESADHTDAAAQGAVPRFAVGDRERHEPGHVDVAGAVQVLHERRCIRLWAGQGQQG